MRNKMSEAPTSVEPMAKTTDHRCSECGWTTGRWAGRCGRCQAWGTVAPHAVSGARTPPPAQRALPIGKVDPTEAAKVPTGIGELDRVLGGGLVPGAVVLLGGEPGIGKSTLLLEVANRWAAKSLTSLYVSAEESAAQVRLRADRINAISDRMLVAAESDLATVLGHVEAASPQLLVIDSVQTVSTGEGAPGGVSQVRDVTTALVRVAKQRNMTVLIVGHVTKEGALAGPRTLEHLVDVVLTFEGESSGELRLVRATKNRFGPADELGCFTMTPTGIAEVTDPSGLFVSDAPASAPGNAITVSMEGRRPLMAQIQALVVRRSQKLPRRVARGVDAGRLTVLLAVLERRAGIKLHSDDVYVSTVGGAKLTDPVNDLAIAMAVASARGDWLPNGHVASFGEVGLSGEIRSVPNLSRRIAEAARLGIKLAIVPRGSKVADVPIRTVEASDVTEALRLFREQCITMEAGTLPTLT